MSKHAQTYRTFNPINRTGTRVLIGLNIVIWLLVGTKLLALIH